MASRQATGRTAELALVRLDPRGGLDQWALEFVLQLVGGAEGRVVLVLPGGGDRRGGVERVIDRDDALVEQARAAVQRLGDDHGLLDEAWSLAERWGDERGMVQVACARAEAAWIGGRTADLRAEAHRGWQLASERDDAWALGELAWWLSLAGSRPVSAVPIAAPFRSMLDGDWQGAAEAWHRCGRALWAAYALGRSTSVGDGRRAVSIGETAGATAAVEAMLRDRRGAGLPVPRRPRPATRANPLHLTPREMEVLGLLAEGLTNPQIGSRLYVSERTVAHHVSAVLQKLGQPNRSAAAAVAVRQGILPTRQPDPARV